MLVALASDPNLPSLNISTRDHHSTTAPTPEAREIDIETCIIKKNVFLINDEMGSQN